MRKVLGDEKVISACICLEEPPRSLISLVEEACEHEQACTSAHTQQLGDACTHLHCGF